MSTEHRRRLNALRLALGTHKAAWEKGFAQLKAYRDREGHCRVPHRFKTPHGFWLGSWVSRQRRVKDKMSPQHRQRLDSLGFVWDAYEAAWEKGFAQLKAYRDREGHCRVPHRFKSRDGFRLGGWVRQLRHTKDIMSSQRRRRLDALGFVWSPLRKL